MWDIDIARVEGAIAAERGIHPPDRVGQGASAFGGELGRGVEDMNAAINDFVRSVDAVGRHGFLGGGGGTNDAGVSDSQGVGFGGGGVGIGEREREQRSRYGLMVPAAVSREQSREREPPPHPPSSHARGYRRQSGRGVDFEADGIPFVEPPVFGPSGLDKSFGSDDDSGGGGGPLSKIFHELRGQVLAGGADQSRSTPSKPPPPATNIQFQLASDSNPYHLLAVRCPNPGSSNNNKNNNKPNNKKNNSNHQEKNDININRTMEEMDGDVEDDDDGASYFAVIMDDRGYVYVRSGEDEDFDPSKRSSGREERDGGEGGGGGGGIGGGQMKTADGGDDGFELLTQFPKPVNELAAQSVYKDGVLFVIATPRVTNLVNVKVELNPDSTGS